MNVVSNSEASRIAGVSRQAIQDLKRINSTNKRKYPFFKHDPDTGKPGVDLDHKDWISYLNRNKSKRVKKDKQSKQTNSKVIESESVNTVNNDNMLKAVVYSLKEGLGLNGVELKRILGLIERKYEEMGK